MTADLTINGVDALARFGARMGDGFLDAIFTPADVKDYVESESRLENGKRIILAAPALAAREVTLTFTVEGASREDFALKRDRLFNALYAGAVEIGIPKAGNEVFHLVYVGKSVSFAMNTARTFCKVSAKFIEPNPANRK